MDPLMRLTLQTPPLSITLTGVDTPSVEKYTHVSMSSSRSIFTDTNWIWSHVGFFGCGGIGSIGS
jgi:hypothetical protein